MTLASLISSCWKPFEMRFPVLMLIILIGLSAPTTAATTSIGCLYPYGEGLDTSALSSDDGSTLINLNMGIPLFGKTYSSIYLNNNGLLSFNRPIINVRFQTFLIPILAPYWSDIDNSACTGCHIYYREVNQTEAELMQRATDDLKAHFRLYQFSASWMFVSTWENVPYLNSVSGKVNTFQAVLISDGKLTFLLFNYLDLQWPFLYNGEQEGPVSYAGLNNEDFSISYQLPNSQSISIVQLNATSNINVTGRWAFNVDRNVLQNSTTFIAFHEFPHLAMLGKIKRKKYIVYKPVTSSIGVQWLGVVLQPSSTKVNGAKL
ncbi:sushi, nidogen and EGF-like domain-containing protein 1 [Hyla sarda]|uniref:sushi, nidogen and EGF-like domain-containing protein 1 n=1 Tax=Hyla sarda TaxID=327740 RepID=UPI0024C28938|nr:sushi, nidogen and EGF-like domain-containing protein 1 [Hyla sarda]